MREAKTIQCGNFGVAHYWLVRLILQHGTEIPTDYDKPNEPASLDLTVMVEVTNPWSANPVFSKAVYDSAAGLFRYKDEVLHGTHDNLTDKMGYTYHDRFKDQMEGVLDELCRNPYTRRAQFTIWCPEEDLGAQYPPCWQRGWFRLIEGKLDFHSIWRSRDAWKAWGSNTFALAHLHRWVADQLDYEVGHYVEFIDSAHIYGRDREAARAAVDRPIDDWCWSLEEIWEAV